MPISSDASSHEPAADPRTVTAVAAAVDRVRRAPTLVEGLRRGDDLVGAAARDRLGSSLPVLAAAVADPRDALTAITAVHALGALPGGPGRSSLLALLVDGPPHLREHAAWAIGAGPTAPDALGPLVGMVARGGFGGMLAQRTLETWATATPDAITSALREGLATAPDAGARTRLVETVGLVPGCSATDLLLSSAGDESEPLGARAAAVAALGDDLRSGAGGVSRVLDALADGEGPLAATARTARHDRQPAAHPAVRTTASGAARHPRDQSVVQLFLHADIDAGLTHAGRGDNGGIATLLVQLGDALVHHGGATTRVVTVSRGAPADGTQDLSELAEPGHHYGRIPLWGPPVHAADAWPLRVAVRRGIRRILRAAMPVDVLHLRMADVGSMAAAEVAEELGVRVVFTLAPDPHAQVAAREAAGTLTRGGFGEADHAEHLVARDHLLRRLARQADHLVLFPRPELHDDIRRLLGVDLADPQLHATVVAEGVDLVGIRRAAAAVAAAGHDDADTPQALGDLDALLQTLPPDRRDLPLVLTVGRLHAVKGTATLVETWATHPDLASRCNLLVVGGDLSAPTDDEAGQLERIHAAVPPAEAASRGLLLAGHRPHAVVAVWMAATRLGRPGLAAPGGVYVCASLKEEFGIAILEAMASGLVVVAPGHGGPPTYVEDGLTGVLVDTADADALVDAVTAALALSHDADATARADAAREGVRARFGIGTMAGSLDTLYGRIASVPADTTPSPDLRRAGAHTPQRVAS
ncbi:MAG TPA: glycosyltransferase [Ornithinibacter sp.]|nr:glycosyltransferase [Ornithinibacter sp.]